MIWALSHVTPRSTGMPAARRWTALLFENSVANRIAGYKSAKSTSRATLEDIDEKVVTWARRSAFGGATMGGQLSGGEQQMMANSRTFLVDPVLEVLDEPTEGLAPIIVAHVCDVLSAIARDDQVTILIVKKNSAVAAEISQDVLIMVNGKNSTVMRSRKLLGGQVDSGSGRRQGHRPLLQF